MYNGLNPQQSPARKNYDPQDNLAIVVGRRLDDRVGAAPLAGLVPKAGRRSPKPATKWSMTNRRGGGEESAGDRGHAQHAAARVRADRPAKIAYFDMALPIGDARPFRRRSSWPT